MDRDLLMGELETLRKVGANFQVKVEEAQRVEQGCSEVVRKCRADLEHASAQAKAASQQLSAVNDELRRTLARIDEIEHELNKAEE